MHYGADEFSKNGLDTITVKDPLHVNAIGQRGDMSYTDKAELNAVYG